MLCVYSTLFFLSILVFFLIPVVEREQKKQLLILPQWWSCLKRPLLQVAQKQEVAVSNLAQDTDVSSQFCSVRIDVLRWWSVSPSKSPTFPHAKLTTHLCLVSRCGKHGAFLLLSLHLRVVVVRHGGTCRFTERNKRTFLDLFYLLQEVCIVTFVREPFKPYRSRDAPTV